MHGITHAIKTEADGVIVRTNWPDRIQARHFHPTYAALYPGELTFDAVREAAALRALSAPDCGTQAAPNRIAVEILAVTRSRHAAQSL